MNTLTNPIDIGLLEDACMAQAASLSMQADQLNAGARGYSETDLRDWKARPDHYALRVSLGGLPRDSNVIGLMLCHADDEDFIADAFLLANSQLGRGIEHEMVRVISQMALACGCGAVVLPLNPSATNAATRDFYSRLGSGIETLPTGALEVAFASIAAEDMLTRVVG
jgi:predicted enzyme involved in methoxymalonyl-ACP biosynthesis